MARRPMGACARLGEGALPLSENASVAPRGTSKRRVAWPISRGVVQVSACHPHMDVEEMEEEGLRAEAAAPPRTLTAAAKGKAKASGGSQPPSNAPWVDKFRPATLADVVAHKDIIDTSALPCRSLRRGHLLPAPAFLLSRTDAGLGVRV